MLDTKALAEATAIIVREHVTSATAPLLERIAALEARQPLAGQKGADGQDGRDGADVDPDEVARVIEEAVTRAVSAIPAPADGKDGADGADGKDGVGADGRDGLDGKDGAGIADLIVDRDGGLVATFTDGRMKSLGVIVGKDGRDGADGKDGRDGMGPENIDVQLMDDARTVRLAFVKGESEYAFQIPFPVVIDRGVFVEGKDYEVGDAVTWGGSLWIAQRPTKSKPDTADSGFRLAVKRGRDGKPAEPVKVSG